MMYFNKQVDAHRKCKKKKKKKIHIFQFSLTFDMPYLVGLDSAGQGREVVDGMERDWMWYNKMGWVGFRIKIQVSY